MIDREQELPIGAAEEDATLRLLRAAGPRAQVSTERAERVRTAVRMAWQTRRQRRVVRRRALLAAALAGAAALVLMSGRVEVPDRLVAPTGEPVATVEAVDGTATGIQRADLVRAGQWIETGPGARVALRFGPDSSVRLDIDSRMRVVSSTIIELSSGAIYVDTGEGREGFEIRTPLGTARDIGTQFEVRIVARSMTLRVRTGMVELRDGSRSITARRGTEVTLSSTDAVTRSIAAHGPEWSWINRVSSPPEMEGVPLATFLARLAREQGWSVEYGDAAIAVKAETIVLHGSVSDLAPEQAVEVAIATSGLRHRLGDGVLAVFPADAH